MNAPPAAAETKARWNPYLVGIGLGVLSWLAFGLANQPLGISTAIASASRVGALPVLGSEGVAQNTYWAKTALQWDGGMLFLVGTFLGSALSVLASRTFRWEAVPVTWARRSLAWVWSSTGTAPAPAWPRSPPEASMR